MSRFFIEKYKELIPYTPGEQPKDIKYIKLNTNESPFAPPKSVSEAAKLAASSLNLYSDPTCYKLIEKLASIYNVSPENIVVNNGSDESLYFSFMAFCDEKNPAAFADITYGFYSVFADFIGIPYSIIPLEADLTIEPKKYMGINKTIFIANPNAPTGLFLPVSDIENIVKSNPDNIVIVDEAYIDFGGESSISLIDKYENVLVVRTYSKSRSMAGARLGFAMGSKELIKDLNTIRYSTNPYNVNTMTLAAGLEYLNHEKYMKNNCSKIIETREYTSNKLNEMGFVTTDSKTNFIFAAHPLLDGGKLYKELKNRGILVRHFDNARIYEYNRITVGTKDQMVVLLETLNDILKTGEAQKE